MRNHGNSKASLMAALTIAALGAGLNVPEQAVTLRTAGEGNNRRPTRPKRDTALQREIADWNARVEREKAEKKLRNLQSRNGGA